MSLRYVINNRTDTVSQLSNSLSSSSVTKRVETVFQMTALLSAWKDFSPVCCGDNLAMMWSPSCPGQEGKP